MPDWLKLIQNEPVPETEEYGIGNLFIVRGALSPRTSVEMDEAGLAGRDPLKGSSGSRPWRMWGCGRAGAQSDVHWLVSGMLRCHVVLASR